MWRSWTFMLGHLPAEAMLLGTTQHKFPWLTYPLTCCYSPSCSFSNTCSKLVLEPLFLGPWLLLCGYEHGWLTSILSELSDSLIPWPPSWKSTHWCAHQPHPCPLFPYCLGFPHNTYHCNPHQHQKPLSCYLTWLSHCPGSVSKMSH